MSIKSVTGFFIGVVILGAASLVMAEDGSAQAAGGLWTFAGIALAAGIGIGIAAFGTGMGMGYAVNGALQGTARNPEAGGRIMTLMILGLALIEALCIYAFVISLMLVLKIPSLTAVLDSIIKTFGG